MGKIVVDIPQPGNLHFKLSDEGNATELVSLLERLSEEQKNQPCKPISFDDVIGIWSDQFNPDEAEKAAREIRESWNRH